MSKEKSPIEKITELNEDCNWKVWSSASGGKMFLDEFISRLTHNKIKIDNIEVKEPEILEFDKLNEDSIVNKVVESFKERSNVGFKKYGVTLDRKDLSPLEWINHLQQELQDAILYAEKLKEDLPEEKQTSYPLLKVEKVNIKSPIGNMSFGVNEVSLNYSLDGKTVTLEIT